jgi:hypothetical protein
MNQLMLEICVHFWDFKNLYKSKVGRGRANRPDHDQQHCFHHAQTVKPEAAIAVVELLMMGVKTPETC